MILRNVLSVIGWSVGTAALVLALGLPRVLDAGPEADKPAAQPTLTVQDCQLSVSLAENQAGKPPVFELRAVNSGGRAADLSFAVSVTYSSPRSEMSRVPVRPKELWKQAGQLSVAPGETRTVTLTCDKPVPAGQLARVILTCGDQGINALSLTPVLPASGKIR